MAYITGGKDLLTLQKNTKKNCITIKHRSRLD